MATGPGSGSGNELTPSAKRASSVIQSKDGRGEVKVEGRNHVFLLWFPKMCLLVSLLSQCYPCYLCGFCLIS